MKKFLYVILSVLLVVFAMSFVACEEENDYYVSTLKEAEYSYNMNVSAVNSVSITLESEKVIEVKDAIIEKAIGIGGKTSSDKTTSYADSDVSATICVRIPNEKLNDFLTFVKGIKDVKVTDEAMTTYLINEESYEVDSEIERLNNLKEEYQKLMIDANTTDKITLIDKISKVDGDISNLIGRKTKMETLTQTAEVEIYVSNFDCDDLDFIDVIDILVVLALFGGGFIALVVAIVILGVKLSNSSKENKKLKELVKHQEK